MANVFVAHAYARAGLIGNPSDGYFGKTISMIVRNFRAEVRVWESPDFEIMPGHGDLVRFDTVGEFLRDQKLHGYYGGMRLIKAAVKRYHDYWEKQGTQAPDRGFSISYSSDIPRLVGLAGSSAIIIAAMRALSQLYDLHIPSEMLPTVALAAERDELHISAGLQDRVIQVYEGIVYMDFKRSLIEGRGYGKYEAMTPPKMPPVYVAYDPARAEVSDLAHRNLRELFEHGDTAVVAAMKQFAVLTDAARAALLAGDWAELGRLMNANFDLRRSIMPIAPENQRMIETARRAGASAKFAGSGGAICGLYEDQRHFAKLSEVLGAIGCSVIRPMVYES